MTIDFVTAMTALRSNCINNWTAKLLSAKTSKKRQIPNTGQRISAMHTLIEQMAH
jgi:hypothetical protein